MNKRKVRQFLRNPKNEKYGVMAISLTFVLACLVGGLL